MSQFAKEFTRVEIRLQPATQIPWYTLVRIMNKCNTHAMCYEDRTSDIVWT